jgi:hypothetical protein
MSYRDLIEPYWSAVPLDKGAEIFAEEFGKLPVASRRLFATHWTQSEVQNGGLGQFFSNDTGILAPEAVEGFRALGMPQTAETLTEAMRQFGEEYPRDRNARDLVTPSIKIEDRFAELLEEEAEGFWKAADRFAAAHR